MSGIPRQILQLAQRNKAQQPPEPDSNLPSLPPSLSAELDPLYLALPSQIDDILGMDGKYWDNQREPTASGSSVVPKLTTAQLARGLKTPYTYRPLPKERGLGFCVRLASFDDSIRTDSELALEFHQVALSYLKGSLLYVAISYVWGEPDFTHSVLCDGGKSHLKITKRLWEILSTFRRLVKDREDKSVNFGKQKFWVDALCINQSDSLERGSQVQEMSRIYRRAEQVHVFLGSRSMVIKDLIMSEWFTRRWVIQVG
jgi:hypothetical protein